MSPVCEGRRVGVYASGQHDLRGRVRGWCVVHTTTQAKLIGVLRALSIWVYTQMGGGCTSLAKS